MSNVAESTNDAITDIYKLEKQFSDTKDVTYFNNETIRILLKYNVVSNDYINKLKNAGKININI